MIWEELNTRQISEVDKELPVLVNLSATEQHGPHLPLGTDRMIGEYFCLRLNERIHDQVLILPNLAIGYSRHHLDFSGTLSLSHETILSQLEELTDSVFRHGFSKFVLFNSHGGNQGLGQIFVEKMGYKYPQGHFVLISWFKLAVDKLQKISQAGPGGAGHGGEFETSLMLRISPHLVSMDEIEEKKNIPSLPWFEGDMFRSPEVSYYRSMLAMTSNGVYGDPKFASYEKGEKIERVVLDNLEKIIKSMVSL